MYTQLEKQTEFQSVKDNEEERNEGDEIRLKVRKRHRFNIEKWENGSRSEERVNGEYLLIKQAISNWDFHFKLKY